MINNWSICFSVIVRSKIILFFLVIWGIKQIEPVLPACGFVTNNTTKLNPLINPSEFKKKHSARISKFGVFLYRVTVWLYPVLYQYRESLNINTCRKRGVCNILHASACACLRWDAWHAWRGWRGGERWGFFLNLGQLNISYRVDSLSSSSIKGQSLFI